MNDICRPGRRILVALGAALGLVACGGEMVVKPGDPAVYERIEASTSCDQLREQAEQSLGAKVESGREAQVAYALAARNRMEELDCY